MMAVLSSSSTMKKYSQTGTKKAKTTPDDKSGVKALHACANSVPTPRNPPLSLVKISCKVPKDEGANGYIGHQNVVVDAKILGPKELCGGGNCNRRDCAGADPYYGGAGVEAAMAAVEKQEESSAHRRHHHCNACRPRNLVLGPKIQVMKEYLRN